MSKKAAGHHKKLQNISRMRRITTGRLPSIMRLDTTKQRHTTLTPRMVTRFMPEAMLKRQ